MYDRQYPLYHPELEHESCGVGAIVEQLLDGQLQ